MAWHFDTAMNRAKLAAHMSGSACYLTFTGYNNAWEVGNRRPPRTVIYVAVNPDGTAVPVNPQGPTGMAWRVNK